MLLVCKSYLIHCLLGGDSKTLMFVQISPLERDLGETLSSLNFATRVRGIDLGPAKKQIDFGEVQKLKLLVSSIAPVQCVCMYACMCGY